METPSPLLLVSYADALAKKNSEALSFIPRPRIEQYARTGQLMVAFENGEPCGFLIHGALGQIVKIYQACIQYDARRREHGLDLVRRLIAKAAAAGSQAISLRCASDLDANAFWRMAGFTHVGTEPGGKRRGRLINVWRMPIVRFEDLL